MNCPICQSELHYNVAIEKHICDSLLCGMEYTQEQLKYCQNKIDHIRSTAFERGYAARKAL